MKKLLVLLLVMSLCLVGCSKEKENNNVDENQQTKSEVKEKTMYLTLRLNMRLLPESRWAIEDALAEILEHDDIGEVAGGGTGLNPDTAEVEYCDIEIDLYDEKYYDKLKDILKNYIKIAKGSKLESDKETIDVGNLEGMAIHLKSKYITEKDYEGDESGNFIDKLIELMGKQYYAYSYSENVDELILYFYGLSYENMSNSIKDYINSNRIFKDSRIEQIA